MPKKEGNKERGWTKCEKRGEVSNIEGLLMG